MVDRMTPAEAAPPSIASIVRGADGQLSIEVLLLQVGRPLRIVVERDGGVSVTRWIDGRPVITGEDVRQEIKAHRTPRRCSCDESVVLRARVAELERHISDLQSGMWINYVYAELEKDISAAVTADRERERKRCAVWFDMWLAGKCSLSEARGGVDSGAPAPVAAPK